MFKKHTSLLTSPLFRRYFTFSWAGQEMSSRQILILTTLINFFGLVNSTLKSWTAKQAMPAMLAVGIQDFTNCWRLGSTGATNWQFSTASWLTISWQDNWGHQPNQPRIHKNSALFFCRISVCLAMFGQGEFLTYNFPFLGVIWVICCWDPPPGDLD